MSDYAPPQYQLLSETGLWSDVRAQSVDPEVVAYAPNFPLWSDGAEKQRWLRLPHGAQIDSSDMDHWHFPVGTRLWKQFSVDGTRIETRLIERYGSGDDDYWMGAFVWRADGSDAELALDGVSDANGSMHDVPSQKQCWSCHNGESGRVLGFSALQLARDPAVSELPGPGLHELIADEILSAAPASADAFRPPGDASAARALAYLHANCGHCHNLHGTAWPDTQMVLRLDVGDSDPTETEVFRTVVDQKLQYYRSSTVSKRVVSGDPDASAVIVRMRSRQRKEQMPPLGSEVVDDDGIAAVSEWITSLAP